jgi:copper chaperone CopZ
MQVKGGNPMSKAYFKVRKEFCMECSLALRRFLGGMEGINGVDVESGSVTVDFDEGKISEERVQMLARDSIDKLGYRVDEE